MTVKTTTEPAMKFVPVRVSVGFDPNVVEDGLTLVNVGVAGTTENGSPFDTGPDTPLRTVIVAEAVDAVNDEGNAAVRLVPLP